MSENTQENSSSTSAVNVLSSILSNPDAIAKMRDIIDKHTNKENRDISPQNNDYSSVNSSETSAFENLDGNSNNQFPTEQNEENNDFASSSPLDIMSIFKHMNNGNDGKNNRHTALLLAVRPYLSKRRQELLDTLIGIEKIGKIFMDIQ